MPLFDGLHQMRRQIVLGNGRSGAMVGLPVAAVLRGARPLQPALRNGQLPPRPDIDGRGRDDARFAALEQRGTASQPTPGAFGLGPSPAQSVEEYEMGSGSLGPGLANLSRVSGMSGTGCEGAVWRAVDPAQ